MKTINLQQLAGTIQAHKACVADGNKPEWAEKHLDRINEMLKDLPSGSGIDAGVKLDIEKSSKDKLVFTFGFHHMDEHGGYDGWTEYLMYIKPAFGSFNLAILGRDRNNIKDYLYDLFNNTFN